MKLNLRFAAFVITYERPDILRKTVEALFRQTLPPEKILIVDNSSSDGTKLLIDSLVNSKLEYYKVGFNSGPAGGALIGLQRLTNEGFDWIYWGDDNDPPDFEFAFSELLQLQLLTNNKVGIVGAVGQYFEKLTGNIKRVDDSVIRENRKFIEVDTIAGGMSMIVNSEVIRAGILPYERLFFGFEELDFCLRVSDAGFKLLVSPKLYLLSREKYGRLDYNVPLYVVKPITSLKRQYYSTRNILIILLRNQLYLAFMVQLVKGIFKAVYGFRFGLKYGIINFKHISRGIIHGILIKL